MVFWIAFADACLRSMNIIFIVDTCDGRFAAHVTR